MYNKIEYILRKIRHIESIKLKIYDFEYTKSYTFFEKLFTLNVQNCVLFV